MGRVLLGVLVLLSLAGQAAAAPVIQRGGPKANVDRKRLNRALDKVAGTVGVCWRGARPKAVSVQVVVAADGTVQRAVANTNGKVAVCAAAVLALQKLAKAAKGYRATIMFPTSGSESAGASTRDAVMRAIKNSVRISACRAKGKRHHGKLNIRFLVKPRGRIVDVEIASSTLNDKSVGRCLVKAIGGLALDLDNKGTVEFVMPFTFGGGGGGGKARSTADTSLQPTKKGPLNTSELSKVMHAARAKFTACYAKQAAKDRTIAGDVVLRYTIRANGTTRNVKIKRTTMNNAAVENCIAGVGKKLRFSRVPGRKETRVVYPFRFAQP